VVNWVNREEPIDYLARMLRMKDLVDAFPPQRLVYRTREEEHDADYTH